MAFTETWNENAPAGGDNPTAGDDEIRDFKFAIRERLAQDHYFLAAEGGSTDIGFHKTTTFLVQGADPAAKANAIIIYGKDVDAKCELFVRHEDGGAVQLGFTDRGDPAAVDWDQTGLTMDGAYHDLDLSAIIPSGANAVLFRVGILDNALDSVIRLRTNGNANAVNIGQIQTMVVSQWHYATMIVNPDTSRKIEYLITAGATNIALTVAGWWN